MDAGEWNPAEVGSGEEAKDSEDGELGGESGPAAKNPGFSEKKSPSGRGVDDGGREDSR